MNKEVTEFINDDKRGGAGGGGIFGGGGTFIFLEGGGGGGGRSSAFLSSNYTLELRIIGFSKLLRATKASYTFLISLVGA